MKTTKEKLIEIIKPRFEQAKLDYIQRKEKEKIERKEQLERELAKLK